MITYFDKLTPDQCYRYLVNLVVPRPIAWVITRGGNQVVNAAPFSVFNMVGEDPPLLMVSVNKLPNGQFKDTARNIRASEQFVVHMACETLIDTIDASAAALPWGQSELAETGLTLIPGRLINVPRVEQAPVAFECVLHETMESESRYVFFGRILCLHTHDGVIDPVTQRVDFDRLEAVGRFGAGLYVRTADRFEPGR